MSRNAICGEASDARTGAGRALVLRRSASLRRAATGLPAEDAAIEMAPIRETGRVATSSPCAGQLQHSSSRGAPELPMPTLQGTIGLQALAAA